MVCTSPTCNSAHQRSTHICTHHTLHAADSHTALMAYICNTHTHTHCSSHKNRNKKQAVVPHRFQQLLQRWRNESGGGGRRIDPRSSLHLLRCCCCHHHRLRTVGKKKKKKALLGFRLDCDQSNFSFATSSAALSAAGPLLFLLFPPLAADSISS